MGWEGDSIVDHFLISYRLGWDVILSFGGWEDGGLDDIGMATAIAVSVTSASIGMAIAIAVTVTNATIGMATAIAVTVTNATIGMATAIAVTVTNATIGKATAIAVAVITTLLLAPLSVWLLL